MRLDKWLKVSRLIKRRTVAKTAVEAGRARLNGRAAKPGTDVHVGDRLELDLGQGTLTVVIAAAPESVPAQQAESLYRIVSDTRVTRD